MLWASFDVVKHPHEISRPLKRAMLKASANTKRSPAMISELPMESHSAK